jgi:serine/threonine-protein kinase
VSAADASNYLPPADTESRTPPPDVTTTTDAAEWRVLFDLLDEVLDREGDDRAAWLAMLAARDPARAARVAMLLAEREAASREGFLGGQAVPPPVTGGRAGARCGPYVLEALVGRGGMGSVWRGRRIDGRYDATVAVKLLAAPMLGADGEKRFRREGQILARLRHPNIAQLLDAGISDDGQPFLALEYVEGAHLDQWADARALSVRDRVRLFLDVLRAVAHAHSKLVVHRDLKPSNILVNGDGRVVLLDFGIAKLIADDDGGAVATQLTRDGAQVLTPRYAAPEQVMSGEITTATDVYALGVVLCELLSGASPYRMPRVSAGALEDAIVTGEPTRPSELAPALRRKVLRGDLDTIVLKALRKTPSERYATVTAFADDLEAWLDGRPVRARPAAFGYRAARFVKRHALAVGAAAVVLVAVLGGAGVALWQARVARAEAERAAEVTNFITGIFRDADPFVGDGRTLSAADLLKQADARLSSQLAEREDLRLQMRWLIGSSLASLQAFGDAEPILVDVAAATGVRYGASDQRALRAQVALAGLHRFRGRLDAMDSTLTRALSALRRHPDVDPLLLVTALIDSVHLAIDRGDAKRAVEPARTALITAESRLPVGHRMRLDALQMYAVALEHGSDDRARALEAAERSMQAALAGFDSVESHPRVVDALLILGRAYGRNGQLRNAVATLARADSASAISLGANNMTRAFVRASTAGYRVDLGQEEQALADYDEAARLFIANGDSASPNYAIVQASRGNLLLALGRDAEAREPLNVALRLMRIARGAGNPRLLSYEIRLAEVELALGRAEVAERQLAALSARVADTTVPLNVRQSWYYTRGLVARARGRADVAVVLLDSAITLDGARPPRRADAVVLAELGRTLLTVGETARARVVLERACAAYRLGDPDVTARERAALALLTQATTRLGS